MPVAHHKSCIHHIRRLSVRSSFRMSASDSSPWHIHPNTTTRASRIHGCDVAPHPVEASDTFHKSLRSNPLRANMPARSTALATRKRSGSTVSTHGLSLCLQATSMRASSPWRLNASTRRNVTIAAPPRRSFVLRNSIIRLWRPSSDGGGFLPHKLCRRTRRATAAASGSQSTPLRW